MADFGIFEAAISSEAEVGLARQAAIDSLSAAIYDVREKLGPALFASVSFEEFRDRVAMMKNDQSLFKIIGAHTPPVTGTVRRIVGKNSVLEKEFKAKLAARPSEGDWDRIMDQPAPSHWQKILDDQDAREKSHAEDWKRSEQMENANREWQDSVRGKKRDEYGDIVGRRRQADSWQPGDSDGWLDSGNGAGSAAGSSLSGSGASSASSPASSSTSDVGSGASGGSKSGLPGGSDYNNALDKLNNGIGLQFQDRLAGGGFNGGGDGIGSGGGVAKPSGPSFGDQLSGGLSALGLGGLDKGPSIPGLGSFPGGGLPNLGDIFKGSAHYYANEWDGSVGAPTPIGGSIDTDATNNGGKGSFAETGKFPTQVTSRRTACYPGCEKNEAHAKKYHKKEGTALDNLEKGERSYDESQAEHGDMFYGPGGSGPKFSEEYLRSHPERFPHGHGVEARRRRAEFSGTQNLDQTFTPSDDELVPEDNFDGYLNSVDQGAAGKVDRNFTSATLYRDWCEANGLSPIRLSSLDRYADRLSDSDYLRLASQIQAWERGAGYPATSPGAKLLKEKTKNSPEVWNEDEGWTDHKPKTPKGQSKDKLKDVTARQRMAYDPSEDHQSKYGPRHQWSAGDNMPDHGAKPALDYPDWGEDGRPTVQWDEGPSKGDGKHRASRDPMRAYINWCQYNNLTRVSARNVARFAGNDVRLCIHLAQRMRNAIHAASRRQAAHKPSDFDRKLLETISVGLALPKDHPHVLREYEERRSGLPPQVGSRRRTAAPDYLQKADDALTQLLNQKAQEFQETIAPLQQALVTVQQAEQLQQQQNPMNVLPPPGTVNVMPGQAAPGQVGQPDPSGGMDPNAVAAAALAPPPDPGQAGLGAAPGGGVPTDQSGPPPAAGPEGALPPELMQATARRRGGQGKGRPPTGGHRTANGSVFDLWERWKSDPNYTQRGGEPDYEAFAKAYNVGERAITKLRQQHASVRAVNRYIAWCTRRGLRAADKKVMTGYHNKVGAAERRRLAAALRRIATEDNDPYGGGFNPNSDPSQRPPSNSVGKGGTPPPVETPPPNPMPNIVPPGPAQVGPWPVYGAPGNNTAADIPGMIGLPTVPGMGFQPHASRRTAKEPVNIAEEAATNQWRKMDSALSAKGYKYDKASKHWTKPGARPVKNHWQIKASWSRLADYLDVRQAAADADLLKAEGDEISTIGEYQDFAQSARALGDDAAANAFEDIIDDEREHVQRFDDQLDRVAANDDWQPVVKGKYVYPGSDGFRPKDDHSQCRHPDACVVQHPELLKKKQSSRKQAWISHAEPTQAGMAGVLDVRQGAQAKVGWTGWGPSVAPKTRQVDNWEWNERLAGYTSGVPQRFSCHCGAFSMPQAVTTNADAGRPGTLTS